MAFPSNPTDGQVSIINNVNYQFSTTGNTWTRITAGGITTGGNVSVSGAMIPSTNVEYDLGTPTQRFRSLYLSGNTIDLGGATIKTDATTGAVAIVPSVTVANPNPTALVISPTGATTTVATTGGTVSDAAIATASSSATAATSLLVSNVQVANSSYTVLDDTAVNTAGGYLVLTGSGFNSNSRVIVGTVNATSTTYVSPTVLRAQVPALAAATYNLYVVDSVTGATAIRVNGLTYSAFPAWSTGSTLSAQASATSFGVNLSATGDGTITYSNTTPIPSGTTLAANGYFYGTVTIGSQTTYSFDVKATDAENQDTARTFSLTVTVTPQGALYSWGYNSAGQTGLNKTTTVFSPAQVGSDVNWTEVSAEWNSLAVKTDGTLWAWGRNNTGQLGVNDVVYRSSPVQIGALTNWSRVCAGSNSATAIKTDGTLWSWGWGYGGMNGQNDTVNRSSPVQIGSSTNWSVLTDKSFYFKAAIKTDGTLWLWGSGAYGLGLGDQTDKSSPTQIGSGTTWRSVSTGRWQVLATKTDGTLWFWGMGRNGPMNTATNQYSPVQVGSGTNWNLVSNGQYAALATKTDGTLWSWGNNANGQLGINDLINRSSPVQVGSDTNWNLISAGLYQSLATKTNNTLWWWGNGSATPFGNQTARSSPTQVGAGTTWLKISIGAGYQALAVSST